MSAVDGAPAFSLELDEEQRALRDWLAVSQGTCCEGIRGGGPRADPMTPILNISCALTDTARHLPMQQALVGAGSPMTYAELDAASDRAAGLLRSANVSLGDRVALVIPNVPQAVIALYGALKAGCTAMPLNPLLTSDEISRVLVHSQARAAIVHETCTEGALRAIAGAEVEFVWTCGGQGIEGTWHFESQVADATGPQPLRPHRAILRCCSTPRGPPARRRQ